MNLRTFAAACAGVVVLASCGAAQADDAYKPGDFLMMDLQQAVLSPKLLGPPASFERVQIEAKADAKTDVKTDPVKAAAKPKLARAPVVKRAAPKKLARSRSNPLDANAADTRVQVWPCRSGGICSWQK
jgi:hypothetical protein